jgi:putative membrane protein
MDAQDVDATRRTRLANERTFLAWLRGGLTSVAVGVGAGAVVPDLTTVTVWPFAVLGIGFGLFGIVLIAYGAARHRRVERALDSGAFPSMDARVPLAFAAAGTALGLLSLLAVLIEL